MIRAVVLIASLHAAHAAFYLPGMKQIAGRDGMDGDASVFKMTAFMENDKPGAWVHTPGASKCNSTLAVQIIKESALPGPPLLPGLDTADGVVAWNSSDLTANMQLSLLLDDAKLVHNIRIDQTSYQMGHFDHYTVTDGNGALVIGSSHCNVGQRCILWQAGQPAAHSRIITIRPVMGSESVGFNVGDKRKNPQFANLKVYGCDRGSLDPVPGPERLGTKGVNGPALSTVPAAHATCGTQRDYFGEERAGCCGKEDDAVGASGQFDAGLSPTCDTPVTMYCVHRLTPYAIDAGFDTIFGPSDGILLSDGTLNWVAITDRFRVPKAFIKKAAELGLITVEEYSADTIRDFGVLRAVAPNSAAYNAYMAEFFVAGGELLQQYPWSTYAKDAEGNADKSKPMVDLEIYIHGMCKEAWALMLAGYEGGVLAAMTNGRLHVGMPGSATAPIPILGSYQLNSIG